MRAASARRPRRGYQLLRRSNLPISADQLLSALGRDNVHSASQKLGIPGATASGGLAALLPALIDQLTPKGRIEQGDDLSVALGALRGKLGV